MKNWTTQEKAGIKKEKKTIGKRNIEIVKEEKKN